jgi:hypothetical protein
MVSKLFEHTYNHPVKMTNGYIFIDKYTHGLLTFKRKVAAVASQLKYTIM